MDEGGPDDGAFTVQIHKTGEKYQLDQFLATHITSEWEAIQAALKGSDRSLTNQDDPVFALGDKVEHQFRREKNIAGLKK